MLVRTFEFLITIISSCISWAFNLVINDSPRITLGVFILACFFIGFVIYFLFGTDFFLPFVSSGASRIGVNKNNSYIKQIPRHSPENVGKDFSTRVSRRKY